jgi:hypothetical protein
MLMLLTAPGGAGGPLADFATTATVTGVTAPGWYRLELDDQVWRRSRSPQPLADVRIGGPNGRELPALVRPVSVTAPPQPREGLKTIKTVDGATVVTLDLGAEPPPHDRVRLDALPGEFVRPVRVEVSTDGSTWHLIASGGIVYQLRSRPPPHSQLVVDHPQDRSRFVRVTVGAGETPARIVGARAFARLDQAELVKPVALAVERSHSDPGSSTTEVWLVEQLKPGEMPLPVEAVVFAAPGAGFSRRVTVSVDGNPIGSGLLYRPRPEDALGGAQQSMRISVTPTRALRFVAEIDNDGAGPLPVARAFGDVGTREIVFHAGVPGMYTLYVGAATAGPPTPPLHAPPDGEITEVHAGPLEPNPLFGNVPKHLVEPIKRHHPWRWIALMLGVGAAGLAFVLRRKLRRAAPAQTRWA